LVIGSNSTAVSNDGYTNMIVGDNNIASGGLIVGSGCISTEEAVAIGFNVGVDDGIAITRG
jgi:hypothetical protein